MKQTFRGLFSLSRADRGDSTLDVSDATDTLASTAHALQAATPPIPDEISISSSRRRLLNSLTNKSGGADMPKRYLGIPAAAAGLVLIFAAVGANAAAGGAPMSEVLGVLGLGATPGDTHGTAVSTAVGDAIASSTPGVDRGEAVSLAACLAAHDRTTLPAGAQAASGQQDKEPKVCATATTVAEEEPTEEPVSAPEVVEASATPTHGQTVRDAVHAAIASSTPGVGRGAAVSEAACTAAHDRTTLPAGAQNAAGQQAREPKDCTHPSATATPAPIGSESTEQTDTSGNGNSGSNGNSGGNGNAGGNGNSGGNGNRGGNSNKP